MRLFHILNQKDMYIDIFSLFKKYNLFPKGVVQIGSHHAEEHEEFVKCGIERFVYIEPCKESYNEMCKRLRLLIPSHWAIDFINESGVGNIYGHRSGNIFVYNIACGSEEKEMPMYVSHQNQGQSNSLLRPDKHTQYHPEIIFDDAEIVKVIPLDKLPIDKDKYDFLYLDVQGAEGMVLEGAKETLKHIKLIYTEVNRDSTYLGNMLVGEMDKFLSEHGFVGLEEHWPSPEWGWGDKIYAKI